MMRLFVLVLAIAFARGSRNTPYAGLIQVDFNASRSTDCSLENVMSGPPRLVICAPGDESAIWKALEREGMHVRLTAGAFEVGMWVMEEGTTLEGAGIWKTTIHKAPWGGTRPIIRSGGSSPRTVRLKGGGTREEFVAPKGAVGETMRTRSLTIRDLSVVGNGKNGEPNQDKSDGIDIRNVIGLTMKFVGVRNMKADGITIRGSRKPEVRPFQPEDFPGYECRDIMMDSLQVENIGGHGISFSDYCTNIVVQNSKVRNAIKSGIDCSRCKSKHHTQRSRIYNNEVTFKSTSINDLGHPTTYAGIRLSNEANLIDVEHNYIENMSRGIFLVSGCSYNNIGDNTIVGPQRSADIYKREQVTSEGIFVQSPYNALFCNVVWGADFSGLYLDGSHSDEGMRDSGFQVHNDQNVFSHHLVHSEGRVGPLPGKDEEGVRITNEGTGLGQNKKTFGNIIKYTSHDKDEFERDSGEWCKKSSFVERAQSLVALRGHGPSLRP